MHVLCIVLSDWIGLYCIISPKSIEWNWTCKRIFWIIFSNHFNNLNGVNRFLYIHGKRKPNYTGEENQPSYSRASYHGHSSDSIFAQSHCQNENDDVPKISNNLWSCHYVKSRWNAIILHPLSNPKKQFSSGVDPRVYLARQTNNSRGSLCQKLVQKGDIIIVPKVALKVKPRWHFNHILIQTQAANVLIHLLSIIHIVDVI